jgi:NAD(P)-dependent dehydrogenase (short-subunit alcohol dehydrogenase family)
MRIEQNTFLVSGGASGLGKATAEHLHRLGAQVMIADLNAELGAQVAATLGKPASFVAMDVTDETSVHTGLEQVIAAFGALHGAISCAGIGTAERLVGKHGAHHLSSFVRVIQVNLVGAFNILRLAANVMAANTPNEQGERGVIINTASVAAFDGQIGQVAYAASKGGVVGMTLPAARDLASLGIRVMTIAPGVFDTPLLASLPQAARNALEQQVPFPPRLGQPKEFASLVAHILQNPMLNGEVIRLDGALRMPPR